MDRMRRDRRPVRSQVTNTCNDIEVEIAKDPLDEIVLRNKRQKLKEKLELLIDLDQKILDAMLDDNCSEADQDSEVEAIEEYRDKIRIGILKIDSKLQPSSPASSMKSARTDVSNSVTSQQRNFKLPKLELKTFNGDLREWLGFWSQFEKIDKDDTLHKSDKFQYLIQAMEPRTEAWDIVHSYPATGDNYPLAVTALKDRFGRESLLLQVYIRELLKMVILNVTNKDRMPLDRMYLKLESHLRALATLNLATADPETWLFPLVESSLPEDTLRAWQRSPLSKKDGKTENPPQTCLDFLMQFIKTEVQSEQRISLAQAGFQEDNSKQRTAVKKNYQTRAEKSKNQQEEVATIAGLHVGVKFSCLFCEKAHDTDKCGKFQSMTLEEKTQEIKKKKGCLVCLKTGHFSKSCRAFVKCIICNRKHYVIMCPELSKHQKSCRSNEKGEQSTRDQTQNLNANFAGTSTILLGTFRCTLTNEEEELEVRALYDPGAQRSYVTTEAAKKLNLHHTSEQKISHSLFGGIQTETQVLKSYEVQILNKIGKGYTQLQVLEKQKICGEIPRLPAGPWLKELKKNKIWISDMANDGNYQIDLLIGADLFGKLLTGKTYQLEGGLTAIETFLGWVVIGSLEPSSKIETNLAMSVINMVVSDDTSLDRLWSLEAIGIQDPAEHKSKSDREVAAKEHFLQTVSRKPDGRYSVRLPWTDGMQEIPSNQKTAQARLKSATAKLVAASKTTPVRPVFDASCKSGRNPSLNECLEKGPNLLELIPSILHRFRERRIGAVADIRKAFQMIDVHEDDRNVLRFLWWEEPEKEKIKIFRHCRVVFGVNCSPFILAAVLEYHLGNVKDGRKLTAQKLLQALYVDNCVTSVDTYEEYDVFRIVATELLAEAKMELRQWECTVGEGTGVGSLISRECGLGPDNSESYQDLTSVLGYQWDKKEDVIRCVISEKQEELPEKLSKRVVLSRVQQIFDPLGFLSPATLPPKIILQRAWTENNLAKSEGCDRKQNVNIWDCELSTQLQNDFRDWYRESSLLGKVAIPRCINRNFKNEELHIFGDASRYAYATVAFLRVETKSGVSVQLVQAKSRVAPLKKISIPRLELMSCTISARIMKSIKESINLQATPTYLWSDSTTALAWLRRNDEWGTFVGNRVKEILRLTSVDHWRHIPGRFNPADLPSRGCTASELLRSRWWEGPEWLRRPHGEWPVEVEIIDEEAVSQEKRKSSVVLNVAPTTMPWYMQRFSTYSSNLRVFAWTLRYVRKLQKKSKESGLLTESELQNAERHMIKLIQIEAFPIARGESVIYGVQVDKADDGVLFLKTKLQNREDSATFKSPILLPSNHPMVEQLIIEVHLRNRHAGVQFLLGKLREKFWIFQGRRAIKKILSRCVTCRRFTTKTVGVPEAPLPEDRVKDAKTFQVTGVDLAGPLFLKNGEKSWIVLFTCAIYRAVHLEMVMALSTDAFLLALHRFISRRGRPEKIYSDNGTNFVGANNLFINLDWKRIERDTRAHRIQWRFNPPSASWWGGWWERLIRTVKDLLKRSLGHSKLNAVQLGTCLCEVEAVVNGRPLTYVTEDKDDLIPLTPAMFLQDIQTCEFPEEECLQADGLNRRYRSLSSLKEELRSRFRTEYLALLVHRGRSQKVREFRVGDVVLVGSDNKKRHEWPMAIIKELILGGDGKCRVAKVKTATGELTRPLQRLFYLEVFKPQLKTITEEKQVEEPKEVVRTRYGRQVKLPDRFKSYSFVSLLI